MQSRTQGGSTTTLLWDPATSPSRLLASGSDRIVYGLGPLYSVNGTTVTTYARDGQKSIRAQLNGTSVTASWRYRAYGEIAQSSGASTPSILGYAGQLLDPSGLYYMRARWYDAANARFLSRDPLRGGAALPLSLNGLAYGALNPLSFGDPTGLDPTIDGSASEGLPYWRQVELDTLRDLRQRFPEDDYDIVYNRAMRDPKTGRTLRDDEGIMRRPDFQVFSRGTRELVHVEEVKSGSPEYVGSRATRTQLDAVERMLEAHPQQPGYGITYRVRLTTGAAMLFLPLIMFTGYLDFREMLAPPPQDHPWT